MCVDYVCRPMYIYRPVCIYDRVLLEPDPVKLRGYVHVRKCGTKHNLQIYDHKNITKFFIS
jgi:hypothetical protein